MIKNQIITFIALLLITCNIFSMDRENKTLALPEELNLEIFEFLIVSWVKEIQFYSDYENVILNINNLRSVSKTLKAETDKVSKRIKLRIDKSRINFEYLDLDYDRTDSNLTDWFKEIQDVCNCNNEITRQNIIKNTKNTYKNILDLIIKYKFEITSSVRFKTLILLSAAEENKKEIVNMLIKNKADVNAKNHQGITALMIAASRGYKEIVEILIKNKADVNLTDNGSTTALRYAARFGFKAIVEILKKNGAV